MTLEQAIEVLISRYNSGVIRSRTNDDEWRLATDTVISALLGPQPDPDTGLVPCGCGGVLELRARPIPWPETYQKGMVTNTKMQYWVFCRVSAIGAPWIT